MIAVCRKVKSSQKAARQCHHQAEGSHVRGTSQGSARFLADSSLMPHPRASHNPNPGHFPLSGR